eukprot:scaffold10117_cov111-Isochrysis_galbana.AAC.7
MGTDRPAQAGVRANPILHCAPALTGAMVSASHSSCSCRATAAPPGCRAGPTHKRAVHPPVPLEAAGSESEAEIARRGRSGSITGAVRFTKGR